MTRVAKRVHEPETEELRWGNKVHKAIEETIKPTAPLTPDLIETVTPYKKVVESIKLIPGNLEVEKQLAVTKFLQPSSYYSDDVWCRGKADVTIENGEVICVFDWKTGGRDEAAILRHSPDQLYLMSLMLKTLYPNAKIFKGAYIWLKHKRLTKFNFLERELSWNKFLPDVMDMEASFANGYWPKRKSGLCKRHCPVHDCVFNGQRS